MNLFGTQSEARKNAAAIIAVACVSIVGYFAISQKNEGRWLASEEKKTYTEPLPESEPVRLRIPDIFIDTNFVPLGLADNGEIEIPKGYTEVGWYTYGPTPGELGPAIVLGHVDSYEGPGVFMYLGQLKEGDVVYVDRTDGTTATFRVTALERYSRNAFPTEKVYGKLPYAGIRLITCSGTYNHETLEYDRILVVYGELVDETAAQ